MASNHICLKTKWTPLTRDYLLSKPWGTLLWVALFSLGTIIPLSFLYEQLGIEMDENTQQIFTSLMKEPWGYVGSGSTGKPKPMMVEKKRMLNSARILPSCSHPKVPR